MKKIGIIGGGFYGCYLANKLKDKFKSEIKIDIFEKNNKLILEAGQNNQHKLHLGFHYPRSYKTREMSQIGFYKFKKNLPNFSNKINNNIYAIANDNRNLTSFKKFISAMNSSNLNFKIIDVKNKGLNIFNLL